jgi:hypothetical protein
MNTATGTWPWKGRRLKGKWATGWVIGPGPVIKDLDFKN